MENNHLSEHLKNPANAKAFNQEKLLVEVASLIYKTMKKKRISCAKLAEALGVTKGRVSQYLGGERNLRLRTLADIFSALDCKLQLNVEENSHVAANWHVIEGCEQLPLAKPRWDSILTECLRGNDSLQLAG